MGEFTLKERKTSYICAYYRPPSDHKSDSVEQLSTIMDSFEQESPILLGGNFNTGDIYWDTYTLAPGSNRKPLCEKLIEYSTSTTWNNSSPLEVQSSICIVQTDLT